MLLDYIKENDIFMLTNQYNAGEFKYLGNFAAEQVKTKQVAQFDRHIDVMLIVEAEEVLLTLKDKELC